MTFRELKKLHNKWVAFNSNKSKVIATAESVEELSAKTKNIKDKLVFTYIMDQNISYAPLCQVI